MTAGPAARLKRPLAHRGATAALSTLWRRGILPEPTFEPARLLADATRNTGLDDFGTEDGWRRPFLLLLEDLAGPARLNPLGRAMAYGQVRKILCDRLRAVALWRRHPEILEHTLAPPVVIVGQARSGTTRLQRLLACDRMFLGSRFHEVFSPIPPRRGPDLRVMQARLALAAIHAFNPRLQHIHPTGARMPEEQFGLFSFSFYGAQLEAQWHLPRFAEWWRSADRHWVYEEFRRLMQTIGWSRGDDAERPWLLKAPQFMEDLDPLLAVFPKSRLLCLHREPADVVASSASLGWNQMTVQSDAVDPHRVGRIWLAKTADRAAAARRALYRHEVPRLDLDYAGVAADWRGAVQRIYAFLGRPVTADTERRMKHYLTAAKRQGFDRHRYALEDFGLDAAAVAAQIFPEEHDRHGAAAVS